MDREAILDAELETWNRLEAKVKEAMDIAKGLRYSGPFSKLNEALGTIQGFRDALKQLHDEFRKH
jgi:hypothetical protein